MHGPVHGVSSLTCSTLRPNRTHGQNSPVLPIADKKIEAFQTINHTMEKTKKQNKQLKQAKKRKQLQ